MPIMHKKRFNTVGRTSPNETAGSGKKQLARKKQVNFDPLMRELWNMPEWEIKKYRGGLYAVRSDEAIKHVTWCFSLQDAVEKLLMDCRSRYPNLAGTTR
jgi:hypothetical protein